MSPGGQGCGDLAMIAQPSGTALLVSGFHFSASLNMSHLLSSVWKLFSGLKLAIYWGQSHLSDKYFGGNKSPNRAAITQPEIVTRHVEKSVACNFMIIPDWSDLVGMWNGIAMIIGLFDAILVSRQRAYGTSASASPVAEQLKMRAGMIGLT